MLVLSRRKNETIYIGDDITITVAEIRKDRVKIGISAPKEIAVMRQELLGTQQKGIARRR